MIKSMTGFGTAMCVCPLRTYNIDIKSINSKNIDITQKLPIELKEKEAEIRQILIQSLERGKIECCITADINAGEVGCNFDKNIAKSHFFELKKWTTENNISATDADLLSLTFKMPDIFEQSKLILSEEDWNKIKQSIKKACSALDENRNSEGKSLEIDFKHRIDLILRFLNDIKKIEPNRHETIKSKILKQLSTLEIDYDKNRFEQELIFYLEKLDFTEEKIRLEKHCSYFLETMEKEQQAGKKLTFISQEIGREINTLGSKAFDADIQKLVVQMKDELEKIKEQLANIL